MRTHGLLDARRSREVQGKAAPCLSITSHAARGPSQIFRGSTRAGIQESGQGWCTARHGSGLANSREPRLLVRNQGTPAVRGILRPEISLRLRYSQGWGATVPKLPRDHEHIAWSNPREHLTERQHPLKLMGRRHIASAHWFIVAEVSDGCACFPEIRKSHPRLHAFKPRWLTRREPADSSPRSGLLTAFLGGRNVIRTRETPPYRRKSPLRDGASISARNRGAH